MIYKYKTKFKNQIVRISFDNKKELPMIPQGSTGEYILIVSNKLIPTKPYKVIYSTYDQYNDLEILVNREIEYFHSQLRVFTKPLNYNIFIEKLNSYFKILDVDIFVSDNTLTIELDKFELFHYDIISNELTTKYLHNPHKIKELFDEYKKE